MSVLNRVPFQRQDRPAEAATAISEEAASVTVLDPAPIQVAGWVHRQVALAT
jgi:hypothetical protein